LELILFGLIIFVLFFLFYKIQISNAQIIINEIAWMGTENSANDEWIELYNTDNQQVDLTGWILEAIDGTPIINLEGFIPTNGYFLLERTDDNSVSNVTADQIYTGALGNTGEYLKLKNDNNDVIDEINCNDGWFSGDNSTKQTMEKTINNWQTSLGPGGTPRTLNSNGKELKDEIIEEPGDKEVKQKKESKESQSSTKPSQSMPATSTKKLVTQFLVANAGNDIVSFVNEEIIFDGSKSYAYNGDKLTYRWNLGQGILKEDSVITYKYSYPGNYIVSLIISDGKNYKEDVITVKIYSKSITINEFLPSPIGKDEENEWIEIYNSSDQVIDISGWQLDDEEGGSDPFVLPENSLISPKSYLVFSREMTKIVLNNNNDSVRLLLPNKMVFQEINYEKAPEGQSSSRGLNGFAWSAPTPGMSNNKPLQLDIKHPSGNNTALSTKNNSNNKSLEQIEPIEKNQLLKDQFRYNLADIEKSSNKNGKIILIIITIILVFFVVILGIIKLKNKF